MHTWSLHDVATCAHLVAQYWLGCLFQIAAGLEAGPSPLHQTCPQTLVAGPSPLHQSLGEFYCGWALLRCLSMSVSYMTVKCPCGETASTGTGKVCRNGITKPLPDNPSEAESQTIWGDMAERMACHVQAVHNIVDWHAALAMVTTECFEVWSSASVPVRARSRSPRLALSSASSRPPIGLRARSPAARLRAHQFQLYDITGRMVTIDLASSTRDALVGLRDAIEGLLQEQL